MRKVQCWYVKMAGVGNIDINIQSRKIRNASYCKEYINADISFDLRFISYFITTPSNFSYYEYIIFLAPLFFNRILNIDMILTITYNSMC